MKTNLALIAAAFLLGFIAASFIDGVMCKADLVALTAERDKYKVDMDAIFTSKENGSPEPEWHTNSELTERDVQLIRSLVGLGVKQASVAIAFCTSFQNVSDIVRGRKWKHVV